MRLPEFRLVPTPVDDAARTSTGFPDADPEVGTRHKVGGEPDWLQPPLVPNCPYNCGPMTFYGQLDSFDGDHPIADVGMVYVFLCFDCYEASAMVQC